MKYIDQKTIVLNTFAGETREDIPKEFSGKVIYPNTGSEYWPEKGRVIHREDGPAVTRSDGRKRWVSHGKKHREDGPAVIYGDGEKEWWWEGDCVGTSQRGFTQADFEQWRKKNG